MTHAEGKGFTKNWACGDSLRFCSQGKGKTRARVLENSQGNLVKRNWNFWAKEMMFLGMHKVYISQCGKLETMKWRTLLSKPTKTVQLPVHLPNVTLQATGCSPLNNRVTNFQPCPWLLEENYGSQSSLQLAEVKWLSSTHWDRKWRDPNGVASKRTWQVFSPA